MKKVILENDYLELEILSLGATLLSFKHKKDMQNIVLRFEDDSLYLNDIGPYLGACIGPVAGRVEEGVFGTHKLTLNSGSNHLHGGTHGIHACDFHVESTQTSAVFTGTVDHSLDGYPGKVDYEIRYSIDKETLSLSMKASPEYEQYINLTNHAYFNLDGSETIAHHRLKIDTHYVGLLDASLAYQGELLDVSSTVLDFREAPLLKDTLEGKHPQFAFTRNLDHMFFAQDLELSLDSKKLAIKSDGPGFQVYAASFFDESFKDEKGRFAKNHAGLAVEPQRPANEVNFNKDHPLYSKENPFVMNASYTLTLI